MTNNPTAGKSLLYYKEIDFAGAPDSIDHGGTGVIAASAESWNYLSVAMTTMYSYTWSKVDPANTSLSYLNHVEEVCSAQFADLQQLYPAQDQFPLQYLGIDPDSAVLVWLDIDAAQSAPNAVATTALVGGSTQSITTLSLPGRPGALGFVVPISGSSVVATCRYGDYDAVTGMVVWIGTGTLIVEFLDNAVTLINAGGFPAYWVFSAPVLQGDGTWYTTLGSGAPAGNILSNLTSDKNTLVNNGVDVATLTASVTDGSGQPTAGVTVSWSVSESHGNLSVSSSQTDVNGQATTELTDNGGVGSISVTASITGSSRSVDIALSSQSSGLTLYQTISYGGNSEPLAVENSELLHNALSQWDWQSARMNGMHMFSHTLIADRTTFDFRTYRDSYDVSDAADLTTFYPQLLSSPTVQGTALSEDDVVVRVLLYPADQSQSVVAATTQSWPNVTETASVSNGIQTVEGVLVVLNKKKGLTQVPLNVGGLNTDTGLVTWQFTSSLTSSWNDSLQTPEVKLGADAPSDWVLYPAQATDKTGEYKSFLQMKAAPATAIMYCSTGSPLNSGMLAAVQPSNKVVIYGSANTTLQLIVSGSAVFKSSGTSSVSVELDVDGYAMTEVCNTVAETVNVSTTVAGNPLSQSMTFTETSDAGAIYVNNQTPADNKTPGTFYWWDYEGAGVNTVQLSVNGSAHFSDGTKSGQFSLNAKGGAVAIDIYDATVETIVATFSPDSPYYVPSTENITFVAYQSE